MRHAWGSIAAMVLVSGLAHGVGVVRQLTSELTTVAAPAALDDAGTAVYTGASADLLGTTLLVGFLLTGRHETRLTFRNLVWFSVVHSY